MREEGNHFLERGVVVLGETILGIGGEQANKGF